MLNVLIIGMTNRMGGVETFIYNTTIFSDKNKIKYYYLVHGAKKCVFQDEITKFYDGEDHFFFIPRYKDNPFKCKKELKIFFEKYKNFFDVIHLETGSTLESFYVYPFNKKYGLKVISHSHNGNGKYPFINKLFQPVVNKISIRKLSCSEIASTWLFGRKKGKEAIIVNNGIDTLKFKFDFQQRENIRRKYNILDTEILIGHVGRFSEQKNHKFLIDIFEEVLKKNPNAKLMLLGTGALESQIKDYVKSKHIAEKVIFAGVQPNTNEYYSSFDVFLMPSLYEGLPVVGIEAQSEGLCCFFSNTIDSRVVITDRAYVFKLSDSAEYWANQILSLATNNNRKDYAKVVDQKGFSIYRTVNTLYEVYDEAANE